MATKNVNSIAASSELAGEDGMAMPGAALKRFTARSQLLVVDAFKGIDPRELTRIEAASRMVEPRDCARSSPRLMRQTRSTRSWIGADLFLDALHSNAILGANLCRMFAARLRRTSTLVRDATFESLEVRPGRQVLYLAQRGGRRTEQRHQPEGRFRQSDLADLLGATTRSIVTIQNTWRANGMVIYEAARAQLTLARESNLQQLNGATADQAALRAILA